MELEKLIIQPKCAACKCYFTPTYRRNGIVHKTCQRCLQYSKNKRYAGEYNCEHDIPKYRCIFCNGTSMCEHKRQLHQCKYCGNVIKITIKKILTNSKSSDIRCNRYNVSEFITHSHVEELITNANKCHYCNIPLQYLDYSHDLGTIDRIDNDIGHNIGNCVISCKTCNTCNIAQISKTL
jgi:hypothetical protein